MRICLPAGRKDIWADMEVRGNSMLHAFSLYGLCGIFNICDFGICSSGRSYLISAPSGVEYGKHHGSADHENVLPLCV